MPQRNRKQEWRETAREKWEGAVGELEELGVEEEEETLAPWQGKRGAVTRVVEVNKRATQEEQRRRSQAVLDEYAHMDLIIYTDGSAEEDTRNGGGGVVITEDGVIVEELSVAAGKHCSSYSAESTAMLEAVRWLSRRAD